MRDSDLGRRTLIRAAGGVITAAALPSWRARSMPAGLLNSAPEAPYKSPITPERVAFLKTKPYKG